MHYLEQLNSTKQTFVLSEDLEIYQSGRNYVSGAILIQV
jgi:hypothetical protein